jgi:HEAT repeat protein
MMNKDSKLESYFSIAGVFVFVAAVFAAFGVDAQTTTPKPVRLELLEKDAELRQIYLGISDKFGGHFMSEMWTLTHAYDSKEEVDLVLNYLTEFFTAVESNDHQKVERLGGARGFKDKMAAFLDSKDQAVKGFAAFMLGAARDISYAPRLVKLINDRDSTFNDRFAGDTIYYRGRAAIALGRLNANEYKADIAKLLKSMNEYDRSGAIFALAELGALEYTEEIVGILKNEKFDFPGDDSPIHFLVVTGTAAKYKNEIVSAMLTTNNSEVVESAAYALAAIGAREHAKDIARLLNVERRKGFAAKALALLGATEYADRISLLLKDKSGLVRSDAVLALGILGSKKYIPLVATCLLSDPEGYVRHYAADAVFFLEASKYYPQALAEIEDGHQGVYLGVSNFHPFVADRAESLSKKLETRIANARASQK